MFGLFGKIYRPGSQVVEVKFVMRQEYAVPYTHMEVLGLSLVADREPVRALENAFSLEPLGFSEHMGVDPKGEGVSRVRSLFSEPMKTVLKNAAEISLLWTSSRLSMANKRMVEVIEALGTDPIESWKLQPSMWSGREPSIVADLRKAASAMAWLHSQYYTTSVPDGLQS